MGFWSPNGDSPFGDRLRRGHQMATKNSLVLLTTRLTSPFRFVTRDTEGDAEVYAQRCTLRS